MKDRMLQRYVEWDYQGRCIYMITVTAFEHRPIFGRLVGDEPKPEIRKSALGAIVGFLKAHSTSLFLRGASATELSGEPKARGASALELNGEKEKRGANAICDCVRSCHKHFDYYL